MRAIQRTIYYCDHCKRARLTRSAIEKHEPRCIYNPHRSACGWHEPRTEIEHPVDHVEQFRETLDTDQLREKMDGCPACMLAVVVQAGLSSGDREDTGFDYAAEVERFREHERREQVVW